MNKIKKVKKIKKTDEDYSCAVSVGTGTPLSMTSAAGGGNVTCCMDRIKSKANEIEWLKTECELLTRKLEDETKRGLRSLGLVADYYFFKRLVELEDSKESSKDARDAYRFAIKALLESCWSREFLKRHKNKIVLDNVLPLNLMEDKRFCYLLDWNVEGIGIETRHPVAADWHFDSYLDAITSENTKFGAYLWSDEHSLDMVCKSTYDYRELYDNVESFVERHMND